MQIMRSYSDLITEIELVKVQIEYTKRELKYWFGIDLDEDQGVPLGSIGTHKFGMNASLIQSDKKITSYQKLNKRLKELEYSKVRMDMLLEQFKGLDYKIAFKRIVELKSHKQIADDLGYSHQYIRERWVKLKTYKQPTDTIANS